MTSKTPEQAAVDSLCPFARTFAAPKATPTCQGPSCALWRWTELSSSLLAPFVQARIASQKEQGEKGGHKEAVAWVMEHREELKIPTAPTHGHCGSGGTP